MMEKFNVKKMSLLLVVFFGIYGSSFAQKKGADNKDVEGYVASKLWDNWFASFGAGAQVYWGEYDREGSFGKRIAPTFELSVGKWITPTLGLRVQYNGLQMKGFGKEDNLYAYGAADKNGYYREKFNYMNVHGDILFNLSTALRGYNPNRRYEIIPYVGFGPAWTYGNSGVGNDEELAFTAGIINKFRVCDAIDINLELKGLMVNQRWDGYAGGKALEGATSVSVGIAYKFNNRKFKKSVKPDYSKYERNISNLERDVNALRAKNNNLADELANERRLRKQEAAKEVTSEVKTSSLAIFFEIGKSKLTSKDMINLKSIAEVIKNSPNKVFRIAGSADKITGSKQINQKLSAARAQNVYDALVNKFNVNPRQLKIIAKGGNQDVSSKEASLNRVTIVE